MAHDQPHFDPEASNGDVTGERGGFIALAVLAAALGAGAALMLAPDRGAKTRQSRRDKRLIALTGVLIGAGLTALLIPEGGPVTRKRLGQTLSRIKVGAVDRIERLRQRQGEAEVGQEDAQVRSVQELGRDPNTVF